MSKLTNVQILEKFKPSVKFPPVVVEQTNFRISDIIRKNQAGQQVLGVKNLQFDYHNGEKNPDFEKVNPFNNMGFDLDDVITLAERNGRAVTDLQNRLGELQAQNLDKSKDSDESPWPRQHCAGRRTACSICCRQLVIGYSN